MTEARYPMEHEPDYARATSTEPTGGSACLQSTPQIARSQGIDSSAFVAAVSRLPIDRKSVVWGKSVSVRVDLGGRRIIKKKKILACDKGRLTLMSKS